MLKPLKLQRPVNILFFAVLMGTLLYFGRELLILISFAALLSMLMAPVASKLESYRVPRVLSSFISVLIIVAVIWGVIMLLSAQISSLIKDFPRLASEAGKFIESMQLWITEELGINIEQHINDTVKEKASGAVGIAGNFLAGLIKGTFTFTGSSLLVLVYTFLFLLQREKYENFIIMLYKPEERQGATELLESIGTIAHKYLEGRLLAVLIIAILYIAGFLIIGLKNAIILSAIAALVAIIPYAGALLGGIIPFIMAIIDASFSQALEVIIVVMIVNVLDHNFIEPYVAGGSLSLNPLFTILVLIIGFVVWGIAGVILFLPLFGIIKIIFERVEGLHPYAYLIGDKSDP